MADAAPRRRRRTTAETPPKPSSEEPRPEPPRSPGKPIGVLQKKLEQFFGAIALPFAAAGDTYCARIIGVERGPVVAEAWANLAQESPAVKAALESLLKGGAWAGAIGATAGMVIPIAAHHGAPIPDPITAIIVGDNPPPPRHQRTEPVAEPVTEPVTEPAPMNGNGTPGPAAVSVPVQSSGPDMHDPAVYPGPHNTTIESD